mgnify:CR=1 FL=1
MPWPMKHKTSQSLYGYWNEVRRGRLAPRRFDIEPSRISQILPATFILERVESERYLFRLAGTRLCEIFAREFRGTNFVRSPEGTWKATKDFFLILPATGASLQDQALRINFRGRRWATDLRWNPGTIADLVQIAQGAGLEPWLTAWAIGGVFGGETASYAVGEFPEACQRDNNGAHLPALCPRQEPFRRVMRAWMDVAVASGVRTVQWDEPQLALPFKAGAERYGCCCGVCQSAFRVQYGTDLPPVATAASERFFAELLTEIVSGCPTIPAWATPARAGKARADTRTR